MKKGFGVIIPLGGIGSRFQEAGFDLPKPLIPALGVPIVFWLLKNLLASAARSRLQWILFIYHPKLRDYRFEDEVRKSFPDLPCHFVCLEKFTRGAAESLLIGSTSFLQLHSDAAQVPVLCMDGDNFYNCDILSRFTGMSCVVAFIDSSNTSAFSFLETKNNLVTGIVEKERVSNLACTGAYGFSSLGLMVHACQNLIDGGQMAKKEFYTSLVIQNIINAGERVECHQVEEKDFICLGTPLQLRLFANNFPRVDAWSSKTVLPSLRYCFDLDNTLVTYPKVVGDYTTVEPIETTINFARYLQKLGHTIIIHTARRMKTHDGNVGAVMADVGRITFETIAKFQIPCDELYFGKPYADAYIDDKALHPFSGLEKRLGFFPDAVKPRDFNTLSYSISTMRKESECGLEGEIFFYQNIPADLKDMFPVMLAYDEENLSWYEMERVMGTTVSSLHIDEHLSVEMLYHIMNSLSRMHKSAWRDDNFKREALDYLYQAKLEERWTKYAAIYSKIPGSSDVYYSLMEHLSRYTSSERPKICLMHGDPVLTNILVNQFGKLKFIDMRGKLGKTCTLLGDANYDWAKLYQSLLGYDEILQGRAVLTSYRNNLIAAFESKLLDFNVDLMEIRMIAKSLLFSLIPLHWNSGDPRSQDKAAQYFSLIHKIQSH